MIGSSRLKSSLVALSSGVAFGTVLMTGQLMSNWHAKREAWPEYAAPFEEALVNCLLLSAFYVVVTALLCVPIWILLRRYRKDSWPASAILGFVAPLAVVALIHGTYPFAILGTRLLIYCGMGALSGLLIWWVGRRGDPNKTSAAIGARQS